MGWGRQCSRMFCHKARITSAVHPPPRNFLKHLQPGVEVAVHHMAECLAVGIGHVACLPLNLFKQRLGVELFGFFVHFQIGTERVAVIFFTPIVRENPVKDFKIYTVVKKLLAQFLEERFCGYFGHKLHLVDG